jgi:hypothetical protein
MLDLRHIPDGEGGSNMIASVILAGIESQNNGAPWASPWSPKTIPTCAKAPVGHPPISETRRSMTQFLITEILPGVKRSSAAKAMVSCVGG